MRSDMIQAADSGGERLTNIIHGKRFLLGILLFQHEPGIYIPTGFCKGPRDSTWTSLRRIRSPIVIKEFDIPLKPS